MRTNEVVKLEFNDFSSDSVSFEKEADIVKFTAPVLHPGTFTGMSGRTLTYSETAIERIFEESEVPIPVELLHGGREIGIVHRLRKDGDTIFAEGILYRDIDVAQRLGAVSAELVLDVNDRNEVLGGKLVKIAFVSNPAVNGAEVRNMEKVALQSGSPEDIIASIVDTIQSLDIDEDTKKALIAALEALLARIKTTYPYPYPYPQPQSTQCSAPESQVESEEGGESMSEHVSLEEFERVKQELEATRKQLEEYRAQIESYQKEIEKLLTEKRDALRAQLEAKGVSKATINEMLKGKDLRQQIEALRVALETASAMPRVVVTAPENAEEAIVDALRKLGLTVEEFDRIMSGK